MWPCKKAIFREEASSALAQCFSCESSVPVELEFGDVGFCGGRKTGEPEKLLKLFDL